MPNVIEWRPFPVQEKFHECSAYEVLFGGAKGPGKTESLLREATRQVDKPNYRGVIFRRTYPRLGEVRDRSFKYYKGMGATYSGDDKLLGLPSWTFPSGAKIAFSHLQREEDKWNHHGKEWHFIGFDEVAEFTESQYLFLMLQNRTSDKEILTYIRSTANPGGVGHAWVKRRFIDSCKPGIVHWFKKVDDEDIECGKDDPLALSRAFIPATVYDNPALLEGDPGYIRKLEASNEAERRAFLLGDWDVFAGQYFTMWRKNRHIIDKEINREFNKFISLDYGYKAPSSVGWWQVDYDGGIHRYRELYKEGLSYERLAETILEMTTDDEQIDYLVADPAIWGDRARHKDNLGESGAETMQNVFGHWTQIIRADNNRLTGWGRMKIMLDKDLLTVSPNCKDLIRTLPSMVHDDKKVEDLNTEGEDHAVDDVRYAVMSRPDTTEKAPPATKAWTEAWWDKQEAKQNRDEDE